MPTGASLGQGPDNAGLDNAGLDKAVPRGQGDDRGARHIRLPSDVPQAAGFPLPSVLPVLAAPLAAGAGSSV